MTNRIAGFEKVLQGLSSAEKAKLTDAARANFKIAFDYNLEPRYDLLSIKRVLHPDCHFKGEPDRMLTDSEKLELFYAFSSFISNSVTMTYDEVEKKYGGHKPDKYDKRFDAGEEHSVFHYQMAMDGLGKTARLHGYIRRGYFVVTRVDWCHRFHQVEKRG